MAVLRNRCDLIGATHIPVAPRLIYKDSPDPILLGLGAARLSANYHDITRLLLLTIIVNSKNRTTNDREVRTIRVQ